MNSFIKILLSLIIAGLTFSCEEKDLTTFDPDGTTVPVLTVPSAIGLSMENEANTVEFSWTKAVYNYPAAISYKLQIAKAGTNFATSHTLYNGSSLSYSTTIKDLNTSLLNNLALEATVNADVEFRVLSSLGEYAADQAGTAKMINLTPYQTVFPPIYMIGAATGGWNTSLAVEMASSAPNTYSTIARFIQNESFRFFAQADWGPTSYNYPYFTTVSTLLGNAQDGDSNLKVLGETGFYRVTVHLGTKTVTMEKVDEPMMYMTGSATGGWDTPGSGNSVKMSFVKPNVWKATATFTNGGAFRFFAQDGWGPVSYNFPYFAGGTVDPKFENVADGDSNFKFTGTTGSYLITLDLNTKTVTLATP